MFSTEMCIPVRSFVLQSFVSLRRIEKYLHAAEVAPVPPLGENPPPVAFHGATVTWPQDRARSGTAAASEAPSVSTTPKTKFMLMDLNIVFPKGELSLVCGKLGSGKTLLLLGACEFCNSLGYYFNWVQRFSGRRTSLLVRSCVPRHLQTP